MRQLLAKGAVCAVLAVAATGIGAQAADLVLRNGKIRTLSENNPNQQVQAIAIEDGEIIYVGNNAGAAGHIRANTEVIDLAGKMVLPGFIDVHMHPLEAGNPVMGTCVLQSGKNPETHIPTIRACAPNQVGTDWVLGFGHSIFDLLDTNRAPADILEDAVPGVPAIFMEETSHSMWVNRTALAAAGIDADTPDPRGGHIVKDNNGDPNGILFDNAGDIVLERALAPTQELEDLAYQGLVAELAKLPALGLTGVSDSRVYWTRNYHKVWQRAEAEGTLNVRANLALWAYPHLGNGQKDDLKALFRFDPQKLLQINQVKFYSDGIGINATAKLRQNYRANYQLTPYARGLNYFNQSRLTNFIRDLELSGFDVMIHAIGDKGIAESLNAIQNAMNANGNRDRRHRVTHLEIRNTSQFQRFYNLDVIADMQVAGDWTFPAAYENDMWPYIGNRARHAIPLKSIYNTGAVVTLSSDYDVSTANPFVNIKNALTRGTESLPTVQSAVEAYTISAAYAMRADDRTGSLEVGKRADLIVIDRNIFTINKNNIDRTKVLFTLMDGTVTHRASSF